jgi:hypothetical protein
VSKRNAFRKVIHCNLKMSLDQEMSLKLLSKLLAIKKSWNNYSLHCWFLCSFRFFRGFLLLYNEIDRWIIMTEPIEILYIITKGCCCCLSILYNILCLLLCFLAFFKSNLKYNNAFCFFQKFYRKMNNLWQGREDLEDFID